MNEDPLPQQRNIWGRRQSRPLKETQRKAFERLWPELVLEIEDVMVNPVELFTPPLEDLWLEIGFGGGEHLAAQAALHSGVGFVGCEPFVNGVASLVMHIQEQSLKNIRVMKDDARLLLARLPEQSVGRIYVLFPDPWPKTRHHKRRMIQNETVTAFAKLLRPGGLLIMATDVAEYGQWMLDVMKDHPAFEANLDGRSSIYERPQDWSITRYEKKGIAAGRAPVYLVYQRVR
jgi:tRNA (guanine-N7-)-methyltransferase